MSELRTLSKDVKTMDVKIKRSKVELSTWLINHSSDVLKGRVQRSIIVTSGMKNPTKKLEFSQVLPRFQSLAVLYLRNRELDNNIRKCFQPIYRG